MVKKKFDDDMPKYYYPCLVFLLVVTFGTIVNESKRSGLVSNTEKQKKELLNDSIKSAKQMQNHQTQNLFWQQKIVRSK